METLWHDLRYRIRMLLKRPGFTITAVVILALGIGANTALFSIVNAVLLRPLPFREPDRLLMVWETNKPKGWDQHKVAPAKFVEWKRQSQIFEDAAAFDQITLTLTGRDEPDQIQVARVSANFFALLGVKLTLGRAFAPNEDQPGKNLVAVISHNLWQRRFAARPEAVGQTITLNDQSYTVIGVAPPNLQVPSETEVWMPLALDTWKSRVAHFLSVMARLKPGVKIEQARAEMNTLARRLSEEFRETDAGWGVSIIPLHEQAVGSVRKSLLVLFGAVGFVLLIACVNMANLMLAQATVREKEFAIRAALGANRSRLIRQLLTESLVLSLTGGLIGLLLPLWSADLLRSFNPYGIPRLNEVSLDARVIIFAFVISTVTGVLFGLLPALQTSKLNLNEMLKEGGRSSATSLGRSLRSGLIVVEVALVIMLLIGAGLLIRSFLRLQAVKPGFNPQNLLTVQLTLPAAKYKKLQRTAFADQVLQRVSNLPAVQSAGVSTRLPLSPTNAIFRFTVEGAPPLSSAELPTTEYRAISDNYFAAMSIPILKGRAFTPQDQGDGSGAVVINQTMAHRFWPNADPVGKRLSVEGPQGPWLTIVGVVGDVKHFGLEAEVKPEMFAPYRQDPWPNLFLVVRTSTDPVSLAAAVRKEVWAVDKDLPVYNIKTMDQRLSDSTAARRFNMLLLSLFALTALTLAAVGIYGVISYSVTQCTQEIGIRLALGAQAADIFKLVIGQGLTLVLAGVVIGLAGAFALTRVMSSLLFGVGAADPITFVMVSVIMIGVALLACYLPARRAMKIDPIIALRFE